MKACNLLVSKHQQIWNFKLLDLEDVRLNKKVDEKRLFRNLLQLNTSIPSLVTRTDCLRFIKTYVEQHPTVRKKKRFLFQLIKKSQQRGIVYIAPQGLVEKGK
jgi:hypothetical protein